MAEPGLVDDAIIIRLPENRVFFVRVPVVGVGQVKGGAEKQTGGCVHFFNVDGRLLVPHGDLTGVGELQCLHNEFLVGLGGVDQPGKMDGGLVVVADVADVTLLGSPADREIPLLIAAQPQLQTHAGVCHVALKGNIHEDQIAALVHEGDGLPGVPEGGPGSVGLPDQGQFARLGLPLRAIEHGAPNRLGGRAGKNISRVPHTLHVEAGRFHLDRHLVVGGLVGHHFDHIIGLQSR